MPTNLRNEDIVTSYKKRFLLEKFFRFIEGEFLRSRIVFWSYLWYNFPNGCEQIESEK